MTQLQSESDATPASAQEGPYPQFLLFGDSLTQYSSSQDLGFNFMPALQNAFIRRLDVINRGFSGYNTAQAKIALPKFMPRPDQASITFMTVFFGANDACLEGSPSNQYIPLPEYSQNLRDILTHQTVIAHKPRLILITPPPVNEYQLEAVVHARGYVGPSRTAENTRKYATACRKVGEELDITVLDMWSTMMAKTGWKEGEKLVGSKEVPMNEALENMLVDGLHFLPPAYKVMYESLMELLLEKWPDLDPDRTSFRLPAWTEAPK